MYTSLDSAVYRHSKTYYVFFEQKNLLLGIKYSSSYPPAFFNFCYLVSGKMFFKGIYRIGYVLSVYKRMVLFFISLLSFLLPSFFVNSLQAIVI